MNNTGQIVRAKVLRDFTVVPNAIAQNKNLSLEEKGLMAYLLSLPSDWVLFKSSLHKVMNEKEGKVDKAFKALQSKGYILSTKQVGSDGRFLGWNHIVYETAISPANTDVPPTPTFTDVGDLPKSVFTDVGESAPIQKTNSIQIHNIIQNIGEETCATPMSETGTGEQPKCLLDKLFMPRPQESNNASSVTIDIIQFLNDLTGLGYKGNAKSTILLVKRRLDDGFTLDDMKLAVQDRVKNWMHDPKMKTYLRPETLFGNKFEGYLQAAKLNEPKIINKPTEETEW